MGGLTKNNRHTPFHLKPRHGRGGCTDDQKPFRRRGTGVKKAPETGSNSTHNVKEREMGEGGDLGGINVNLTHERTVILWHVNDTRVVTHVRLGKLDHLGGGVMCPWYQQ